MLTDEQIFEFIKDNNSWFSAEGNTTVKQAVIDAFRMGLEQGWWLEQENQQKHQFDEENMGDI